MGRLQVLAVAVLATATILLLSSTSFAGYLPPPGGWTYCYQGEAADEGPTGVFDSLDGNWDFDNGSCEWDGSIIGAGRPGGASALSDADGTRYLRIQDTGDPRDYGMGDPGSNRKLMFAYDINEDLGGAATDILDTGVTLSFRARVPSNNYPPLDDLHPDGGGGPVPYPGNGDAYLIHDGGKGLGIQQEVGGAVGFHFAMEADPDNPGVITTDGLVMNNLNGNAVTGDVDPGEAGTLNLLPLNPIMWHEFWINIEKDPSGAGTHQVTIWKDDDVANPDTFLVTAGSGSDYDMTVLTMEQGATPLSGCVDIDFMCYAPGLHDPVIPEPATLVLLATGLLSLLVWRRRR